MKKEILNSKIILKADFNNLIVESPEDFKFSLINIKNFILLNKFPVVAPFT